ncbi:MAG: hypothetical protein FD123_2327 [Bacteroidetes bacterium]|nr:MAG: hypothetical protein FD123_2327 [Bacteroidota bacterium]
MKTLPIKILFLPALLFFMTGTVAAQSTTDTTKVQKEKEGKIFVVTKNDGTEFVGKIISQDAREVVIETQKLGQIAIPKHEIREIKEVDKGDMTSDGEYIPKEVFSTRYFITTNGLPIEKGESYVQWNLFGPDFQFGVGKNFGMGIMTSWIGMPIIGSAKYSMELGDNVSLGLGTLVGTGSWVAPDWGMALPFGALTIGDRKRNINFSGGYGAVFYDGNSEGRALCSVAGMFKAGNKISLVFDSFIMLPGKSEQVLVTGYNYSSGTSYSYYEARKKPGFALLIPGIRWQTDSKKAFQFGFAGLSVDGEVVPVPIPMVQWYRKL